jgi:hypothetical protein
MYTKKHNFIVSINTPIENIAVNMSLLLQNLCLN